MINETMRSAIHEALGAHNGDDLIRGVKSVLIHELSALDPAVKIENTGYFNHTFVPDLVMKWGTVPENKNVTYFSALAFERPRWGVTSRLWPRGRLSC